MSTPGPTNPRRRRIAGERRGRTDETLPASVPPAPHSESDASLSQPALAPPAGPEDTEAAVGAADLAGSEPVSLGGRVGPWLSIPALVALGVVTAAAVVVASVLGLVTWNVRAVAQADAVSAAEPVAVSTAERAAPVILGYDYRKMDADKLAAQGWMTADFATKYGDTIDSVVSANAVSLHAVVTATAQAAAVVSATPARAKVLVFVDQITKSDANKKPQTALNRVAFDMVLVDGSWLVSDITSY